MILRRAPNMTLRLNHYQPSFCEQLRSKMLPIRTRQSHPTAKAEVQPQIPIQQRGSICGQTHLVVALSLHRIRGKAGRLGCGIFGLVTIP
jgi:hypothetical protein